MKNTDLLKKIKCKQNDSLIKVMRIIDEGELRIAMVYDDAGKNFVGVITDSDIRKAILKGADIQDDISKIANRKPIIIKENELSDSKIITEIIEGVFIKHIDPRILPVINGKNEMNNLLFVFSDRTYKTLDKGIKQDKIAKNVLVIGGAGYLGSILSRKLLDRGYKVRVMDMCLFGEEPIAKLKNDKNFEFIKEDMRNISSITKALIGIDAVVLLAAIVGDPASKAQPVDTIETNYLATKMIAEACKYHQINRFIFASTCSVYGKSENILDEKSELNPISLYARSKVESEQAILGLADKNFSPTIMRMGTLYGLSSRMRFDLVVNIFALHAVTKGKIKIFGGKQWRPLLNVEDAADAYIACLEASILKVREEIFNVGSEEQNYQINKLGSLVKEVFNNVEIEYQDHEIIDGKLDNRDYKVSFEKIRGVLNFDPKKTVKEGLKEIGQTIMSGEITDYEDSKYYN